MEKLTNPTWLLRDAEGIHIVEFKSDQVYVWVTQRAVIVYDLPAKTGYGILYNERTKIFEGEHRQLWVSDTVYAPDHTQWLWMTDEEKQRVTKLLRHVISFRSGPLPGTYGEIWKHGVNEVKTLAIQKAGRVKYFPKFVPGLG